MKLQAKITKKLRKIVLFQNLPDYRDDSKVDARLKEDYEEKNATTKQKPRKSNFRKKL